MDFQRSHQIQQINKFKALILFLSILCLSSCVSYKFNVDNVPVTATPKLDGTLTNVTCNYASNDDKLGQIVFTDIIGNRLWGIDDKFLKNIQLSLSQAINNSRLLSSSSSNIIVKATIMKLAIAPVPQQSTDMIIRYDVIRDGKSIFKNDIYSFGNQGILFNSEGSHAVEIAVNTNIKKFISALMEAQFTN